MLLVDDRAVDLGYRQRELVTRLALGSESGLERKQIASDIWPETDITRAAFYLRRLLSELRCDLGPSSFILESTVRGSLSLRHVHCDVREFLRAVTSERDDRLRHAISLYKGPLLPSSNAFWVLPFRDRITDLCISALDRLARSSAARSESREAASLLRSAVEIDPVSETLRCKLMRSLAEGGDPAAALAEYERFREHLETRLNVRPSSDVIRLANSIRSVARSPRPTNDPFEELRTSLPIPPTSLIGRADEVDLAAKRLRGARLVTLVGPAGVGKTRLAIAVAEKVQREFENGVWFCDFSATSSPEHLWHTMATSLRGEPGPNCQTTVVKLLAETCSLVVLDNCEHLIEGVAVVAETLLTAAPNLKLLCTSREPLHLSGEQVFGIQPLDPEREAVALFFDVASRAGQTLRREPETLAAVAGVCSLVDGLPLGIEIAASHLRLMSLSRLKEVVLKGAHQLRQRRGRDKRQQNMAAAVDWSYKLLSEPERRCLRACGLAHGSIHIDALSQILSTPREEVEGWLLSLRDRSLIQEFSADRIRLLETFRQYAANQLGSEGEADAAWVRYIEWIQSVGMMSSEPWPSLDSELPMVQAALEWCRASPERAELGLILLVSINRTWGLFASRQEAIDQLREFLTRSAPPDLAAVVHQVIGTYRHDLGDFVGAEESLNEGMLAAGKARVPGLRASLYCLRGTLDLSKGELQVAKKYFLRANRRLLREGSHAVLRAHNLVWLAKTQDLMGDLEGFLQSIREARAIFQSRGFAAETATTLLVEGRAEYRRGSASRAVALFEESLNLYLARGESYQGARAYVCLGLAMLNLGDPNGAEHLSRGHDLADQIGLDRNVLYEDMRSAEKRPGDVLSGA